MSCLVRLHEQPVMMIDDIALGVGPIGAVLLQPNIQSDFYAQGRSSSAITLSHTDNSNWLCEVYSQLHCVPVFDH